MMASQPSITCESRGGGVFRASLGRPGTASLRTPAASRPPPKGRRQLRCLCVTAPTWQRRATMQLHLGASAHPVWCVDESIAPDARCRSWTSAAITRFTSERASVVAAGPAAPHALRKVLLASAGIDTVPSALLFQLQFKQWHTVVV